MEVRGWMTTSSRVEAGNREMRWETELRVAWETPVGESRSGVRKTRRR